MNNKFLVYIVCAGLILNPNLVVAKEKVKSILYKQKITMTAKEKLGKKFSDKQRVNNCKVPKEKRGTKTRSAECKQR